MPGIAKVQSNIYFDILQLLFAMVLDLARDSTL